MEANDFERIMLPHLDAAYNLARWITHDRHNAEDLVQDAYLRAFRFFHGFRPEDGDGKAWLLAIVRNTCFTWLKQQKPRAELDENAAESPSKSPQLQVLGKERERAVSGCVDALPSEHREVIVMRELEEMSYQEIADAVGLAIGTVMSRLSRARKRLKDCLAAKFGGTP